MQDRLDRIFVDLGFKEEQKVDVRLRMNGLASISADSEKCKTLRIAITRVPKPPDHFIHLVADGAFDRDHARRFQETRLQIVEKLANFRSCHASLSAWYHLETRGL